MRKVIVLWNRKAGKNPGQEKQIQEALEKAGLQGEVRALRGPQLGEEARRAAASDADVVVAAGGDGTVSAVAGALAGGSKPMGVLPMGTLNHFAKDLSLPLNLTQAVEGIAKGTPHPVDVAEVNGNVFVNNSSLGLYPTIVREREQQRVRLGRNKWLALFFATFSVFRRFPTLQVRLNTREDSEHLNTPLVFVGNNEYEVDLLSVKGRTCLDRGELSLYLVRSASRFALLRLAILSLIGSLRQERDFSAQCLKEFWVETRRRSLDVALDGEVIRMKPPLHYKTRPKALMVMRPVAEAAGAEPEGLKLLTKSNF